jgi:hypothetical protein
VLCNIRKNVKVIVQQPHTSSRTIGKSDTVGYWVYERRSGYLVLPLAMPQHSLATYNSITRQVLLLITFWKPSVGVPRSTFKRMG